MPPEPITTKDAALEYLNVLQRSYEIGAIGWSREMGAWFAQAGEDERLAMLDILAPEDSPRCSDPYARSAAARSYAELCELRAGLRERYVARRFDVPE